VQPRPVNMLRVEADPGISDRGLQAPAVPDRLCGSVELLVGLLAQLRRRAAGATLRSQHPCGAWRSTMPGAGPRGTGAVVQ
jgi:hypothetical protein